MCFMDIDRISREVPWAVRYVESTGSTNTDLLAAGEAGEVLIANEQTAGKGRLGRSWAAPVGTQLTFSVLLCPPEMDRLGTLPLAAGLAVADSVPGSVLKWPNDVQIRGKKLCGILAEATVGPRVVLGMGINVTAAPLETATCLADEGLPGDRTELAITVLNNLHRRVEQWNSGEDFMADYRKVCSSIGLDVRLEAPTGTITGVVEGIADDGRINVSGTYYSAGDVTHLRPAEANSAVDGTAGER